MLFGRIWLKIKFIVLGDYCCMNYSIKYYLDIVIVVNYICLVIEVYVVFVYVD